VAYSRSCSSSSSTSADSWYAPDWWIQPFRWGRRALDTLKDINLAVRFLLELAALGVFVHWGFRTGRTISSRVALGIGIPVVIAVIWTLLVAPDSTVDTSGTVKFIIELAIFAAAVAVLARLREYRLAPILSAIYIINRILMAVWNQ
jgi:hypothetical protein